jgi:hypothetical protein
MKRRLYAVSIVEKARENSAEEWTWARKHTTKLVQPPKVWALKDPRSLGPNPTPPSVRRGQLTNFARRNS